MSVQQIYASYVASLAGSRTSFRERGAHASGERDPEGSNEKERTLHRMSPRRFKSVCRVLPREVRSHDVEIVRLEDLLRQEENNPNAAIRSAVSAVICDSETGHLVGGSVPGQRDTGDGPFVCTGELQSCRVLNYRGEGAGGARFRFGRRNRDAKGICGIECSSLSEMEHWHHRVHGRSGEFSEMEHYHHRVHGRPGETTFC